MSVFVGIAMYVVIWWISLFAVLPWGLQPVQKDDVGHGAGAPANPRLLLKVGVTTVVAAILWLVMFWIIQSGLVDLRS